MIDQEMKDTLDRMTRLTRKTAQYDLYLLVRSYGDSGRDVLLSKLDDYMKQADDERARLQARAIAHSVKHDNMSSFLSWSMMVYREMRED